MHKNLGDLIDLDKVSKFLVGFNKSTGFVTAILDLEGNVLSKSGWREICTEFHRVNPKTSERCTYSDTVLAEKMDKGEKYHAYTCLNGLTDVAVPLEINGQYVGNLFSGQFLFEEPDTDFFRKQAKKFGFDEKKYMKALSKVPVISEEKVKTIMDFLLQMTNLINELGEEKTEQVELNKRLRESEKEQQTVNQQLNAKNQQLQASEQQLRALNQQLEAQNQQLQASEQQLKHSEQKFRSLFEQASVGVAIIDTPTGKYQSVNKKQCDIVGYTEDEILKLDFKEITHPDDIDEDLANMQRLKNGEIDEFIMEKRYFHKDSSIVWVNLTVSRLWLPEEEPLLHVALCEDITERKRTEEKLKTFNQQLDANNQQLHATEQQLRAANKQLTASEEKFRSYIQNAPDGIFITNENGKYIEVNTAACEITGYPKSELLNLTIAELIHEEYTEKALNHFQSVAKEGFASGEFGFVTKSGEKRFWNVDAVKLSETRFLGFAKDITERKQANEALIESKEKLRVTLESIGDGVITTDTQGKITFINSISEKLTGWNRQEATGQPISEIFHLVDEASGEPCENPVDHVLKTGMHTEMKKYTQLIAKSGKRYLIRDSADPIQGLESSLVGVVLVFRDITEEIKTEKMMQQVAKLESLGTLAGGLAHDFNNLLGGIFGYVQLAESSFQNGEDCRPYLQEFFSVFEEAKGLTQQLLTLTKGGHLELKPHALSPVIREAASFYLSGSNIDCTYDFPDDLSQATIDINQFKQVVQNLIQNAQQAMPNGGMITISAENTYLKPSQLPPLEEGEFVHIKVADEGVGIPAKILKNIFDPFFTTKQKGSGLGLASCYSILRNHKGLITVDSEVNSGTTFHLYLPSSSDTAVPAEVATSAVHHHGTGRVLVMDDEPYMRDVLTKMLESMGYSVTAVSDGKAVLELYPQFSDAAEQLPEFSAAFFDLTVPGGMGGRETLEKLSEASCKTIPFVFACSGYSQDDIIAHPNKYGFTDSIQKPFRKEELEPFLNKHLG
ncbi:MAG: PAS domain S-box protein [Spirochaetia bacterium]|nr:PAS domain S-box protein [Spirochaetia bacterium]